MEATDIEQRIRRNLGLCSHSIFNNAQGPSQKTIRQPGNYKKKEETPDEESKKDENGRPKRPQTIEISSTEFRIRRWLMQGKDTKGRKIKEKDTLFEALEEQIENKMKQILRSSAAKIFWEEASSQLSEIHKNCIPKPGHQTSNTRPRCQNETEIPYTKINQGVRINKEHSGKIERKPDCAHSSQDYERIYHNHSDDNSNDCNEQETDDGQPQRRPEQKRVRINPYRRPVLETPHKYETQPCERCNKPQHQYKECPTNRQGFWK